MNPHMLLKQLQSLEYQKKEIEAQILQIKKELEKHSTFSKSGKIVLFRSLYLSG